MTHVRTNHFTYCERNCQITEDHAKFSYLKTRWRFNCHRTGTATDPTVYHTEPPSPTPPHPTYTSTEQHLTVLWNKEPDKPVRLVPFLGHGLSTSTNETDKLEEKKIVKFCWCILPTCLANSHKQTTAIILTLHSHYDTSFFVNNSVSNYNPLLKRCNPLLSSYFSWTLTYLTNEFNFDPLVFQFAPSLFEGDIHLKTQHH